MVNVTFDINVTHVTGIVKRNKSFFDVGEKEECPAGRA